MKIYIRMNNEDVIIANNSKQYGQLMKACEAGSGVFLLKDAEINGSLVWGDTVVMIHNISTFILY